MSSTCKVLKVETNQESVWVNFEFRFFIHLCTKKKRCMWDHSLVLVYWSQLSQEEGDDSKSGEKLNTLP